MTEDKIKILFDQIKLDQETIDKLVDVKLEKVKVNEKNGSWTFVLESPNVLDIEDYRKLDELTRNAFTNIKHTYIEIIPKYKDFDKLKDYYDYALEN